MDTLQIIIFSTKQVNMQKTYKKL